MLSDELRMERNTVLQCIRYVVQRDFFKKPHGEPEVAAVGDGGEGDEEGEGEGEGEVEEEEGEGEGEEETGGEVGTGGEEDEEDN